MPRTKEMTVQELIDLLEQFNHHAKVRINDDVLKSSNIVDIRNVEGRTVAVLFTDEE